MRNLKMAAGLLAAASLLTFGASSAAGASTAKVHPNATPACSFNCFSLSGLQFGPSQIMNAYIPGNLGTGAKIGQKVNLHFATDTQVNADFTGGQVGTLVNFCQSGLNPTGTLSAQSYACINYPSTYPVYEADVSPFGNQSGFCAGVALPATSGENVTLRSCGNEGPATLWIGDLAHAHFVSGHVYTPLVSGASAATSHPLVLTVVSSGKPQNQLTVQPENLLTGNFVNNAQMWTLRFGPAV
jgi:hypothetical protein